jgi:predicted lipoprotein
MRVAFALLALVACGDNNQSGERKQVAIELVTDVVMPTVDDVATTTMAMRVAAEAFVANPTVDTLHALQAAWVAARVPWKHADAFGFGPANDLRLTAAMDQAVDTLKIETEVTNTPPITDAYVDALGANAKGFHALEYLVFGGDDVSRLALLTTDIDAARRREMIVAYAQNLERRGGELRTAWVTEQAAIADAGGNDMYPTLQAPLDAFVNESVFLAEFAADTRLGKPSGTATGGVPQPQLAESAPSDNSMPDLTDSLRGIRNIYFGSLDGTPGKGVGKLVAPRAANTDASVKAALDTAFADVAAIPRPFTTALVDQRIEIQNALASIKELKTILATEVVATLGVTLKFNDNDGD